MRILRTISTPWAPYSLMFSRDGTRLAIGGGSWYGNGGILLVDLSSHDTELFHCKDLPAYANAPTGPSVSGVCFSPDDRHLIASTWSSSQRLGPTVVFEVSGLALRYRATIVTGSTFGAVDSDATPTGVVLHDGHAIVRSHRVQLADMITIARLPPEVDTGDVLASEHLTSSRLVIVGDNAITGNDGLRGPRRDSSLVMLPLSSGAPEPERWGTPSGRLEARRITAIGTTRSGGIVSGGADGELAAWTWNGSLDQRRLRSGMKHQTMEFPGLDLSWSSYSPNSIVGICSLADDDCTVSVSAGGEICWFETQPPDPSIDSFQIPEPGTPRSLAAHPDGRLIAVGIKKGGGGGPASAVVIAEVRPIAIDRAWRAPAVLAMARALHDHRRSTGALDLTAFVVLADALEEAGCSPRILDHLRHHDSRLRDCWILDALLADGY